MKKLNILSALFFAASLIWLSACEERIVTDYTPYEPDENISITYEDLNLYPELTTLVSDTPNISVSTVYTLKIDSVVTTDGAYKFSNFKIDQNSGVITYNNSDGSINPGKYSITVIIATPNAYNKVENALNLTIEDVPVSLTASPKQYTAGALEQGDISTISYTDDSPDQSITNVSYALSPTVTGYSIDETTGVISKTTAAAADTTVALGIKVTTNLGVKTIDSVVMVTVGPPPTIEMKQSNGTDKLNSVTLSPWTAYTTGTPDLQGMNDDGGWEILVADTNNLGATVDPTWFAIDANGVISIAADQNLPIGDIVLGVRPTNSSGISYDFDSLFTIHVEKRWQPETDTVYYQNFNAATTTVLNPEDYDSRLEGFVLGSTNKPFKVSDWVISAKNSEFFAARILAGNSDADINDVLLLKLTVQADWRDIRVSFKEFYGYGAAIFNALTRTLSYGYDYSDLQGGSMDPNNWTPLYPSWVTNVGWGNNKTDADFTPVPPVELNFDYTQPNVYINWHYQIANQGGQIYIDEIKVELAIAFPAEEQ